MATEHKCGVGMWGHAGGTSPRKVLAYVGRCGLERLQSGTNSVLQEHGAGRGPGWAAADQRSDGGVAAGLPGPGGVRSRAEEVSLARNVVPSSQG